jgi:hypothetical protein
MKLMTNQTTVDDYMMASCEAARYLGVSEKALIDTGVKWGLNPLFPRRVADDGEGGPVLFSPRQIYDHKINRLRSLPLISADDLDEIMEKEANML